MLSFLYVSFKNDSDAQVTLEDQQKINKFARHNAKMQDLKEELVQKKVRFFGILPTFQCNTTNLNACTLRKASTAAQGLVINGVFFIVASSSADGIK